jgi:hypothetical protein
MKEYMGRRGIAPLILNLRNRWRQVHNFMPQLLCSQERILVRMNRRLWWATKPVGTFMEKIEISCPYWDVIPGPSIL